MVRTWKIREGQSTFCSRFPLTDIVCQRIPSADARLLRFLFSPWPRALEDLTPQTCERTDDQCQRTETADKWMVNNLPGPSRKLFCYALGDGRHPDGCGEELASCSFYPSTIDYRCRSDFQGQPTFTGLLRCNIPGPIDGVSVKKGARLKGIRLYFEGVAPQLRLYFTSEPNGHDRGGGLWRATRW